MQKSATDVKQTTGTSGFDDKSRPSLVSRPSAVVQTSTAGKREVSGPGKIGDKDEYLKKRKLMPAYATSIHVWGFVVGTVISGEFSGFNAGYANGLGSMIVAHVLCSILMGTVSLNLTELVTAMPFASGCAAYASGAFNGAVACFIGYAYTFDMVFIGAEVTAFMGVALQALFGTETNYNILYYLVTILVCTAINFHPKVYFNVITVMTVISCLLVIIPLFAVAPQFDFKDAFVTNVLMPDGTITTSTDFLPFGISGVINSFPLALYLLICFESMPCCVEETQAIATSIPRGMLAANLTLLSMSWIALVVTAGMPPGQSVLQAAILPYS
ncbi:hypothetical protein CcCBS67573_g07606 [Chytriomyces confervae]|uniref:Amino acid permease/ SLC12A domain-containing protein n=1 Tax=Chytriomyces confervae TaxID=246404 RepID=A0A507EUV3_9FUNG|nr:hypothetical protein CcCBS67573_g07606 [Chytriomyces confervae]